MTLAAGTRYYDLDHLSGMIRRHADFPIAGIRFADIFPIFLDPLAVAALVDHLVERVGKAVSPEMPVDIVVGLDARGFLLGPALAMRLGAGFVPVRKAGKLPGKVARVEYTKDYGPDRFEMQDGSIQAGQRILLLDDVLATGGSADAAADLVRRSGGTILLHLFLIEAAGVGGRDRLDGAVEALFLLE